MKVFALILLAFALFSLIGIGVFIGLSDNHDSSPPFSKHDDTPTNEFTKTQDKPTPIAPETRPNSSAPQNNLTHNSTSNVLEKAKKIIDFKNKDTTTLSNKKILTFTDSYTGRSIQNKTGVITFKTYEPWCGEKEHQPYTPEKINTSTPPIIKKIAINTKGIAEINFKDGTFLAEINIDGYPIHLKDLYINDSLQEINFRLSQAGSLKIKAADQTGKSIKDIDVSIYDSKSFDDLIFLDFIVEDQPTINFIKKYNQKQQTHLLTEIPAGTRKVTVKATGYQPVAFHTNIRPSKVSTQKIILKNIPPITFRLTGTKNLPKTITIVTIPKNIEEIHAIKHTSLTKNKNNQYQWYGNLKNFTEFYICIDGFKTFCASPQQNKFNYQIPLTPTIRRSVLVFDNNNIPMIQAEVSYLQLNYYQKVLTDKNGYASLRHILREESLDIYVDQKGFKTAKKQLNLLSNEKQLIIKMTKEEYQKGIVQFEGEPVVGATVNVSTSNNSFIVTSDAKGEFSIPRDSAGKYTVSAFHDNYGRAQKINFIDTYASERIQVNLAQSPITLKFKHINNEPFANKWIQYTPEDSYEQTLKTNAQGVITIKNSFSGKYKIKLINENNFMLQSDYDRIKANNDENKKTVNRLTLPNDDKRVFTLLKKPIIKLSIIDQDNNFITKGVKVLLDTEMHIELSMDYSPPEIAAPITIVDNKHITFSAYQENNRNFTVNIQGVHIEEIKLSEAIWIGEKAYMIHTNKGKPFHINIIDQITKEPINQAKLYILCQKNKASYEICLTTDKDGGAIKTIDADVLQININAKGYIHHYQYVKTKNNNNLVFELQKGGSIDGFINQADNENQAYISLSDGTLRGSYYRGRSNFMHTTKVQKDGKFKINKIKAGAYNVYIRMKKGEDFLKEEYKIIQSKLGIPIFIENEKVLKLNLSKDGNTALDINIIGNNKNTISARLWNSALENRNKQFNITNNHLHIPRISPGRYTLHLGEEYPAISKKFFIENDAKNSIQVQLNNIVPLTVILKDSKGAPLSEAQIQIFNGKTMKATQQAHAGDLITSEGRLTTNLFTHQYYYITIRHNFESRADDNPKENSIYQRIFIKPFLLNNQLGKTLSITVPVGRELPNIQITNQEGEPLFGADFNISHDQSLFLQGSCSYQFTPYSNKNGFLPTRGWPQEGFYICVTHDKFETRTIYIPKNFDTSKVFQVQLKPEATIICQIPKSLRYPISMGILNLSGKLINQAHIGTGGKKFSNYKSAITKGKRTFTNLAHGTYYIGYFWNDSEKLISKQGPFHLETGQELKVIANIRFDK